MISGPFGFRAQIDHWRPDWSLLGRWLYFHLGSHAKLIKYTRTIFFYVSNSCAKFVMLQFRIMLCKGVCIKQHLYEIKHLFWLQLYWMCRPWIVARLPRGVSLPQEGASLLHSLYCWTLFIHCTTCPPYPPGKTAKARVFSTQFKGITCKIHKLFLFLFIHHYTSSP